MSNIVRVISYESYVTFQSKFGLLLLEFFSSDFSIENLNLILKNVFGGWQSFKCIIGFYQILFVDFIVQDQAKIELRLLLIARFLIGWRPVAGLTSAIRSILIWYFIFAYQLYFWISSFIFAFAFDTEMSFSAFEKILDGGK